MEKKKMNSSKGCHLVIVLHFFHCDNLLNIPLCHFPLILFTVDLRTSTAAQLSRLRDGHTVRKGMKPQTCLRAPNDQPVALEAALVKWSLKRNPHQSQNKGSNYLPSIRPSDVLKMLTGHTEETCPIIIFITHRVAERVKICAHPTFRLKGEDK